MMNLHDIHIHTHLSLCAKPDAKFDAYLKNARKMGLKLIGFSDHMWDTGRDDAPEDFYRIQNLKHVLSLRDEISQQDDLKILVGCETEFTRDSVLGISPDAARQLDYVVIPHSHTHFEFVMPQELKYNYKAHAEWLLDSFCRLMRHPDVELATTIVHPFAPCIVEKADEVLCYLSDEQFRQAFEMTAAHGVGLEINAAIMRFARCDIPEFARQSQYLRMMKIAKECGCKFSLGSDAHTPDEQNGYEKLSVMTELLNLTEEDYVPLVRNL